MKATKIIAPVSSNLSRFALAGAAFLTATASATDVTDVWNGGSGLWNVAANWSGGVPNNGTPTGTTYDVLIDNGNPVASSVTLNVNATINNLSVDANDSLSFNNGTALTIQGTTITNKGNINLNSSGSLTELVIGAPSVTLTGGGTVTLSNSAANYILGAATADTLTNQETIQGAGNIGNGSMTLVNSGTINSNGSAGMTLYTAGGTTNTGTIEATAGSKLTINGTTVTNTGGTVAANASTIELLNTTVNGGTVTLTGASTLQLWNGLVHGGSTLTNSATGVIESLAGTNTLGGTVNNSAGGLIKVDNGSVLNLESGTYAQLGAVQVNSTGSATELAIPGTGSSVTLSGGSVTLSNSAANYILGAATADTLTNQETISGAGNIGNGSLTLVNSGTINSNGSAGMTLYTAGGTTNTGTIESTAGSKLTINGTTVTNTGGTVTANASTVELINSTVNGGTATLTGASTLQLWNGLVHGGSTLTNSATGVIESLAGTNTLGGTVNNSAGGLIKVDNGSVLNLESGTYAQLGTVQVNSTGSATELAIPGTSSSVTLTGGSVTLSNNANNYILGAATADTLTNQETISGAGNIGNGSLTLVNSGTINSNGSAGMTLYTAGGTTNTGTIEATAGSKLTANGTTVTNTGGTVTANASTLELINSTVNGGTVTLTGASTLQLWNGLVHGGSTLTNSATGVIESLAGTNTLGGTVNNSAGGLIKVDNGSVLDLESGAYAKLGTVQVNSTGSATELGIAGTGSNVILSGGSVTLSNNANNYLLGASSTDTLTNQETISGAGNIGNGSLTLVNSGTINSNGSAGMTLYTAGGTTNTGTIEATKGSKLTVNGTTVTNTGGKLLATAATVELINSTVNGGAVTLTGASTLQLWNGVVQTGSVLTNSATGVIESLAGTNTLGGTVKNSAGGLVKIDNGSVLDLEAGTYATLGAVQVNSTGSVTELAIPGSTSNVTLSGGSVTMSNNFNNYILGAANADTLTNEETISGAGHIGNGTLTLVNSGTIDASGSAGMLIQVNGGLTNSGTLMVGSGVLMHVAGGPFSNFAGTTLTGGTYDTAGTLEIDQLGTAGGEIVTNAANIVLDGAGATFVDGGSKNALSNFAVNAAKSSFTVTNGSNFTTAGNFTNNGTLSVGTGSTFAVGGSLTNFAGTTLTGGTYNVTGTFQFAGANIVTNAATIALTGSILNSTTSTDALANFASNTTKGSFGLFGGRNFTTAGNFTNSGTLTVDVGSTFAVGGSLTNYKTTKLTGGTYDINGTLEFAGANIVTDSAKITLGAPGADILNSTTSADALANLSSTTATGLIGVAGGRNFTTAGNFSNAGTIAVGAGSTFAVGGSLSNFSGTTLTGGIYNVTGTMQFAGANIVTDAANISLTGTSSLIQNSTTSADALANLAATSAAGTFGISGGRNFTTAGNFTNGGTLTVGTGSTFAVGGSLTNFSGTTLTGGTYNVAGTMQFAGANIVTNAASITLTGATSAILNSTGGGNALANLATNTGSFALATKRSFGTVGNFGSSGNLTIGAGSTFTVGGTGVFTQSGGTTTDSGILSASGGVNLSSGSLFGTGSIKGALASSGIINPGLSSASTGILTETGAYTQNSAGALDISIGGTTAGTKYDVLNVTTANLGGTLNLALINGFVPTVGSTYKIMNYSSASGAFAVENGLSINSTEHFTVTTQGTDLLLSVVAGPAPAGSLRSIPPLASASGAPSSSSTGLRLALESGLRSPEPQGRYMGAAPPQLASIAAPVDSLSLTSAHLGFQLSMAPHAFSMPSLGVDAVSAHPGAATALGALRGLAPGVRATTASPAHRMAPRGTHQANLQFAFSNLFTHPRWGFSGGSD